MQTKAKIYVLTWQRDCIRLGLQTSPKEIIARYDLMKLCPKALDMTCVG